MLGFNFRDTVRTGPVAVTAGSTATVTRAAAWSALTNYNAGDVVIYNSVVYKCLMNNVQGTDPASHTDQWSSLAGKEKWFILALLFQSASTLAGSLTITSKPSGAGTSVSPPMIVPDTSRPPGGMSFNPYGWFEANAFGDDCVFTAGSGSNIYVSALLGYQQKGT